MYVHLFCSKCWGDNGGMLGLLCPRKISKLVLAEESFSLVKFPDIQKYEFNVLVWWDLSRLDAFLSSQASQSLISVSDTFIQKAMFTYFMCWCWNNALWHFVQANTPFYSVACVIKGYVDGSVNISLKSNQMLVHGSRRDTQMHKNKGGSWHTRVSQGQTSALSSLLMPPA